MAEQVSTRPLIDKLGVMPGARVAVIDVPDPAFRALLAARTDDVSDGEPAPDTDLVFLGADTLDALGRQRQLRMRLGVVVLAAGLASRFGGPKLLAPLGGHPILQHVLDAVAGIRPATVVVVLGEDAGQIEAAILWRGEHRVRNPDPGRGLASSLQLGMTALEGGELEVDAALIVLGDQPRVRVDVMEALVATALGADRPIVAPRYEADTAINPVLLGRPVWPLVAGTRGDRGLGPLIGVHPELVTWVPVAGANPDVDTLADLEALT